MECDIGPTGVTWAALRFSQPLYDEGRAGRPFRCPRCHSRDCAPSLPTRRFDSFFVRLHRVPYECRVCGKRFRWFSRRQAEQVASQLEAMLR
jgi:hypothetical protein